MRTVWFVPDEVRAATEAKAVRRDEVHSHGAEKGMHVDPVRRSAW